MIIIFYNINNDYCCSHHQEVVCGVSSAVSSCSGGDDPPGAPPGAPLEDSTDAPSKQHLKELEESLMQKILKTKELLKHEQKSRDGGFSNTKYNTFFDFFILL